MPEEYYYPAAVNYLNRILETNRADNMRQALDMLDEQVHRWRMEELSKESIEVQRQQKAVLDDIWWQNHLMMMDQDI